MTAATRANHAATARGASVIWNGLDGSGCGSVALVEDRSLDVDIPTASPVPARRRAT
jgi:hypothetical protein